MSQYSSSPPSYTTEVGGNGRRTYHVPNYSQPIPEERAPLLNRNRAKPQNHAVSKFWILVALVPTILAFTGGLFITLPSNDPAVWRRDRLAYMDDRDLWQEQKQAHTADELVWKERTQTHTRQELVWRQAHDRQELAWKQEHAKEELLLAEKRRAFDRERSMMDKKRVIWNNERVQMVTARENFKFESENWAIERAEREQEMDRWMRERRWREEQYENTPPGAYWQEPVPEPQCHAYGKRKYTARITAVPGGWNWVDACKALPIHFHERTVLTPDQCVDTGRSGTYGHYVIDFGETACEEALFTNFRELGCVARGSRMRRTEAEIRNINPGDDWKAICGTTPATIHGVKHDGPSHCEERFGWGGSSRRVAVWDIEDSTC